MPRIRSDDGPRRIRAIWLGPRGLTLPIEWTYGQWFISLAGLALCAVISLALLRLFMPLPSALIYATIWGGAAGFYAGSKLARTASHDEPIAYRIRMLLDQLANRGIPIEPMRTITHRMPPITELSTGARRAIDWTQTATKENRHETSVPSVTQR